MSTIRTQIDPRTGALTVVRTPAYEFARPDIGGLGTGEASMLRKPYQSSVWVMAAIRYLSDPIAAAPLEFYQDSRSGEVPLNDQALEVFWDQPAESTGGRMRRGKFLSATIGWLKIRGEAFWVMDDTWLSRGPSKSRLMLARPQDMREVMEGGELVGWVHTDKVGRRPLTLLPEQVVHIKNWNPYDEVRGLGEWEAAKVAAEADYAAGTFARALAMNNGDRGPIIASDVVLTPEQQEQMVRALTEKRIRAARGDFRPTFVNGQVKVQEPTVKSVDADYVAQRIENRHEIFVAFKVPPSFADVTASYSVGSASDRYKLIEEGCMPLAEELSEAIEEVATAFREGIRLGDGPDRRQQVYAAFSFANHSTMQEVRSEKLERGKELWAAGMPWEKINELLDLGMQPFVGWERAWIPFSLQEVREGEEERPPQPSEEAGAKGMQGRCKGLAGEMQEVLARSPRRETRAPEEGERDPERVKLWEKLHSQRRPWEKRFESRFTRELMKARRETLENIEANHKALAGKGAPEQRAGLLDLVFDLAKWLQVFTGSMVELTRAALEKAAAEMWETELGKDPEEDPMVALPEEVREAVRSRENLLSKTGAEIWQEVKETLEDGLSDGDTTEQLAARVKEAFNGISNERAKRIAVTETTAAYEAGRKAAMKRGGVRWKEWITSGDERVRHTHRKADGQVVGVNDKFRVGGADLEHPGDSKGPAGEVVNCRCVSAASLGPPTDPSAEEPEPEEEQEG